MVKLVDTLDLGSSASRRGGSSPSTRTNFKGRNMREILLEALRSHAQGHVDKHKANVEVYLHSTTGIGEHPDIIEAMEGELMEMAKYQDQLEMIDKYFS